MSENTDRLLTRLAARITLGAMVAQFAVVLFSWLLSATSTGSSVRSLLSAEGLRWFWGTVLDGMSSPLLASLLLVAMTTGAAGGCGLWSSVRTALSGGRQTYRHHVALAVSLTLIVLLLAAYAAAGLAPHALLSGVTGSLWISPFLAGLLPAVCIAVMLGAIAYGFQTGTLTGVDDAFHPFVRGLKTAAPLVPPLITLLTLWRSLMFAIGL